MRDPLKKFSTWELAVLELRQLLEDKKINQVQIAQITGLKQPNISRLLNMDHQCKLRTFCQVLDAAGLQLKIVDKLVNDKSETC